ncbi:MAG: GNAT family N-acetyltransferase [Oscillospiraceae bacterium]|nr:GNAT family N-acetyltransferase [Oscillospiraceae bacterium]
MEHKGTKRLETPRLILRAFTPEDGPAMYRNWASDPEVTRFLTWKKHTSPAESTEIAARWAKDAADPACYQWALVLKELGEPIGSLGVVRRCDETAAAEMGYCIGRPWWGRGLTAEALRAAVEYLIREVGMNRVAACHDVENPNSGKVMQKAGMTKEGVLRSYMRSNHGLGDIAVWSVLARELK